MVVKTSAKRENWGSGGAKTPAGSRGGAPGRRFVLCTVWRVVIVVVFVMCGFELLVCFVAAFRRYFWIMINDIPCPDDADSAIYADDCSLFKSGRNLKFIVRHVQAALDRVVEWTDQWGFKLSTEKTVAMLFTHHISDVEFELHIRGNKVKIEKKVKFLGVIFDHKLTWEDHIVYIENRCKKRINLMRSISGNHWRACKQTLVTIYKALIRPIMDYGCIAYVGFEVSGMLPESFGNFR